LRGLQLVAVDIEAAAPSSSAAASMWERRSTTGVGVFYQLGADWQATCPDPERRDYGSFASFSDPDGNGWVSKR